MVADETESGNRHEQASRRHPGVEVVWILGLPRVMRPLDRTYVGPKPETVL